MVFNSIEFAIFFVVVIALYFLLQNRLNWQNRMLFVASSIFYGWWDWRFLFLMYFTIVFDFFIARQILKTTAQRSRKNLLLLSVISNLTILGFFKYFNFFAESTLDFLNLFGFSASPLLLNVILPVGISFYIFQSISYVVDVYNRRLEPAKSLVDYATYVCLFPQLVAGPIERGTHLLPQVLSPRKVSLQGFYEGGFLIFWGLFKKLFIADNLARIVDPVFSGSNQYSGADVLIATYAFAFQIYCDFSGYTDIARGAAKCLGFELMLNFRLPYFASNPSEFWRRWHISLSTWLRDYLYIALGGNKNGNARTYLNLMLTMLLGGLWHGAHWNFVIWGGYQGLLLVVHRRFAPPVSENPQKRTLNRILKLISIFVFFQFICFGWLIFRAESAQQIFDMTLAIASGVDMNSFFSQLPRTLFYILPLLVVQIAQFRSNNLNVIFESNILLKVFFYVGMFYAILSFGSFGSKEFIYFQF